MSKTSSSLDLVEKSSNFLLMQNINDNNYPWEFIVFALKESSNFTDRVINHDATYLKVKGLQF